MNTILTFFDKIGFGVGNAADETGKRYSQLELF